MFLSNLIVRYQPKCATVNVVIFSNISVWWTFGRLVISSYFSKNVRTFLGKSTDVFSKKCVFSVQFWYKKMVCGGWDIRQSICHVWTLVLRVCPLLQSFLHLIPQSIALRCLIGRISKIKTSQFQNLYLYYLCLVYQHCICVQL